MNVTEPQPRECLGNLLHLLRPRLLLLARQWVRSSEDAEDVVQEALVRFWRRSGGSPIEDPTAYLCSCVRSASIDFVRSSQRRARNDAQATVPDPMFECPLELSERRMLLENCLAELPIEQREVVTLRIWGQLSFPQIASVIGIPANTAASRFRYAVEALRRLFEGKESP